MVALPTVVLARYVFPNQLVPEKIFQSESKVVEAIVISAVPSKLTPFIALAVASLVAVSALPVRLPVTLPVKVPVIDEVAVKVPTVNLPMVLEAE